MPIKYPSTSEEWVEKAFGKVMLDAFEDKANKKRDFLTHNKQVFDAAEMLWNPAVGSGIIHPGLDGRQSYLLCLNAMRGIEPNQNQGFS